MEAINILKRASAGKNKPYCSFENLPAGDYLIAEFALVDTKHGTRLRLDLGDKVVLLPERFSANLKPEHIVDLNKSQQFLIYYGKDVANRNK